MYILLGFFVGKDVFYLWRLVQKLIDIIWKGYLIDLHNNLLYYWGKNIETNIVDKFCHRFNVILVTQTIWVSYKIQTVNLLDLENKMLSSYKYRIVTI